MKGKCFSEALFHATMDGRKTQFREEVKSRTGFYQVCSKNGVVTDIWQTDANEWCGDNLIPVKPRYKVGETVYLKEPYYKGEGFNGEFTLYKFDGDSLILPHCDKWANSLFMPESAARHFIKITNVRAERLQDISEEDCLKEGIKVGKCGNESNWMKAFYCPDDNQPHITAKDAYEAEFNMINGKDSWEQNPWVWVYDYEILK